MDTHTRTHTHTHTHTPRAAGERGVAQVPVLQKVPEGLPPMVPPQYRPSNYTLVVDLEDTLIYNEWTVRAG